MGDADSAGLSAGVRVSAARPKFFAYGWGPYLEDHLRLGWLQASLIYQRGEHDSWLLVWLCDCRCVKPNKRDDDHSVPAPSPET
jgi:hypothetical protein